ncbi:DUF421 domain-containing protein [Clostridium tagluense]|uniref:DUF421 domain-containing protein n=1 Tax=Clostridium tagluense TaxID=360422 RepID=UPI001CF21843|nr:DUF421 domain-containing protein [Clostridium tagluense]MCB2314071.1 DUF421 domain-containing protein [Clostridium tagluense]MCB2318908.1 DUF421 domain-containing protein [Clostridium tagluense]MCB2323813.1 DUF421 domain-containing protein [Clostridium tagluense]MCB2328629.1 DUF421 domain-containing protein [Clostridium tagluense]MCB2333523.1 DUF421 domain-containing protein [Clostridium tagluense]
MNEGLIVLVRGIIGFFTLLIFTRILGKQQVSQLTFFDYVVGITIGSTASSLTTDLTSRAWPHWVGLFTWTALCLILQLITLKSKTAEKYLDGQPTIVIINGKILEESMKKFRYTIGDLLSQLRDKDIFDIDQVAYAILEKDGQLSILKKTQCDPVTPKDLNLKTSPASIDFEVIYDGSILQDSLDKINRNERWLMKQLKSKGINDTSEVFLAIYNATSGLHIDLYKDHIKKNNK